MSEPISLENIDRYRDPAVMDTASVRDIRERYADVNAWGWQDGVLKDIETLEPVSIVGDTPGWEFVVCLPGDVKYLLGKIDSLSEAYNEVLAALVEKLKAEQEPS